MFQMVDQARKNQSNPMEMLKQITSNKTPQQMDEFYKKTEQMGFPTEIIDQIKNGINTK